MHSSGAKWAATIQAWRANMTRKAMTEIWEKDKYLWPAMKGIFTKCLGRFFSLPLGERWNKFWNTLMHLRESGGLGSAVVNQWRSCSRVLWGVPWTLLPSTAETWSVPLHWSHVIRIVDRSEPVRLRALRTGEPSTGQLHCSKVRNAKAVERSSVAPAHNLPCNGQTSYWLAAVQGHSCLFIGNTSLQELRLSSRKNDGYHYLTLSLLVLVDQSPLITDNHGWTILIVGSACDSPAISTIQCLVSRFFRSFTNHRRTPRGIARNYEIAHPHWNCWIHKNSGGQLVKGSTNAQRFLDEQQQ